MALILSRIDRIYKVYDVTATLAAGGPGTISGVSAALLPIRTAPTAATVWVDTDYADGEVTILFAGPDADPTDALVVPADADLWFKVADSPEVDAEKVERITLLGAGGSFPSLTPQTGGVSSVNGMTGDVTITGLPPTGGAGGALSGTYPNPGLNETTVDTIIGGKVATGGSATRTAINAILPAAYTDEQARDTIAAALVAGSNVTITPNDGADTITVATAATVNSSDATLLARANHTGTQTTSTVTGLDAALATLGRAAQRNLPGMWVGAYAGVVQDATTLDGTYTSASTFVQPHRIAVDCTDLRVVLPWGWKLALADPMDAALANGTPTKVAIQIGSRVFPVTFRDGVRSLTCDPGGRLVSAPIGGFFAAGSEVKIRLLLGSTSGAVWPATKPASGPGYTPATLAAFTKNSDIVDTTTAGATTVGTDALWGAGLLGRPTAAAPFVVGALGDSITNGQGDTGTGSSWLTRAVNATAPCYNVTRNGITATMVASQAPFSLPLLSGASHAIVMLGVNDFQANRTFAQASADLTTVYKSVAAQGCKVIGATITPKTTSTDSWVTTGNQTASGTSFTGGAASERALTNAWIRGGAGGLILGYIETADTVETARDSGIWKASHTADGLHPNATGHAAMAAAVNLATIAAL